VSPRPSSAYPIQATVHLKSDPPRLCIDGHFPLKVHLEKVRLSTPEVVRLNPISHPLRSFLTNLNI
jgi:hypothetical protein